MLPDFSPISLSLVASDPVQAARLLGNSFTETGFAVIKDHGITPEIIARANAQMQALFALPEAEKRQFHQPDGAGQRGYTPFGQEVAKGARARDLKEFWHVGRDLATDHPQRHTMPENIWPDSLLPKFRPAMEALFKTLDYTGTKLLSAIALHLGWQPDFLLNATKDGNSILRLLHYPPVPEGVSGIRAGAHEDINVITLLLGAEEAGLEILTRDGNWVRVPAPEGTLICNIGDMLERQSGGRLPSTTHRVTNPDAARRHLPRYSMPFFLHFRPDWMINPDPPSADHPPISTHDFLLERLGEIGLI